MGERISTLKVMFSDDPAFMRRVNGWLAVFWLVMIPISLAMHWLSSVVYVSALSLWALVSGHWSAWQAARTEVQQRAAEERRLEEDLAGDVVHRIVTKTDVSPVEPSPTDSV